MNRRLTPISLALLALFVSVVPSAFALEAEDYEEPAGANVDFLLNPTDDLYGLSVGGGMWLRETPVYADYFVSLFDDGYEDAWYSAVGMTLRLMPHWRLAPFAGAGGSYDYGLGNNSAEDRTDPASARAENYWGGHVEAGVRAWLPWRYRMLELGGRYTWTSLPDERAYWTAFIGMGAEL
jgi:hypothetical protein